MNFLKPFNSSYPFHRLIALVKTISILIIVVVLLSLKIPIRDQFLTSDLNHFTIELVSEVTTRIPLILFCILVLKNFEGRLYESFANYTKANNLSVVVPPILLFSIFIIGRFEEFDNLSRVQLYMLLITSLAIGFTEEFIFRGVLLPYWIKQYNNTYIGVLATSLIFGLFHYVNLFKQPDNFAGVTSQVIFAFIFGVYLAGLMLRTRNILLVSLVHTFFNLAFTSLLVPHESSKDNNAKLEGDGNSLLLTVGVYLLIAGIGIYMTWKENQTRDITFD